MMSVKFRTAAAILALSLALNSALNASTVTVTGGFTSFSGVVGGTNNGITSILNANQLCADTGCQNTDQANVLFITPQTSVTFQNFSPFPNAGNQVQFQPAGPQQIGPVGPFASNSFLLGQMTYTNGIWTGDATFGFTIVTQSADPLWNGKVFTDKLILRLTPNDFVHNSPAANADYIYFQNNPGLGSVRAYELQDSPIGFNTVTVDVIGFIDDLNLLEFTNPQGGGFIDSSINLTLADATPLPGALPLFATGLGALGLIGWRRKKKSAALAA